MSLAIIMPLEMRCHVHSHRSGYMRVHVSRSRGAGPPSLEVIQDRMLQKMGLT